jgi:hypothetical protein
MHRSLIVILFLCISTAVAEEVIPKVGDKCPSGYRNGKGAYCYNQHSDDKKNVTEKVRDACPSGYRNGRGAYCYGNSSSRTVIAKQQNKCPRGYRDGPGHYCYQ